MDAKLTPIPTDANIENHLWGVCGGADAELYEILEDMKRTVEQTKEAGEPDIFAFGKLLNFLASEKYMDEPKRIRLLAAAIWELTEL